MGALVNDDLNELRGLALPDRNVTFENLAAVDGTPAGSTYDEAGPRPGQAIPDDPRSRLIVEIQNAQDDPLEVIVQKPGTPGTGDASAAVQWRVLGDPDSEIRSYNRPALLHHFRTIDFDVLTGAEAFDAAVMPSSHKVILAYLKAGGGLRVRVFDTNWGTEKDAGAGLPQGTGSTSIAVYVLPTSRPERIVITTENVAVFSDDEGDTWEAYSDTPVTVGAAVRQGRALVIDESVAWLLEEDVAPHDWIQLVSKDLGYNFDQVGLLSIAVGDNPQILPMPNGGLGVAYIDAGTVNPTFRAVGSPFDSLAIAIPVVIDAAFTATWLAATVEPDGVFWVVAGSVAVARVYRSVDSGATWSLLEFEVYDVSGGIILTPRIAKLVAVDGGILMIHQWVNDGTDEFSLQAAWLGGWQNVGTPVRDFGFGGEPGIAAPVLVNAWFPGRLPIDSGYSVVGAGTEAIVSPGLLQLTTAAQQLRYQRLLSTEMSFVEIIDINIQSGGSLTQPDAGIVVILADGVNERRFTVNFLSAAGPETQFRIIDGVSGGTLADVVPIPGNPAGLVQLKVEAFGTTGQLDIWWRLSAPAQQWTLAFSGTLTNDGTPVGSGLFQWGHTLVGTATSQWQLVEFSSDTSQALAFGADGDGRGRAIGPQGFPVGWIGGQFPAGRFVTDVVLMGLRGGPARQAETQTILAAHDYGVENIFAEVSPSPANQHRTRDRTAPVYSWPFPNTSRIGTSWIVAIYAENFNWGRCFLDARFGASSFTEIATFDGAAGFDGLDFVRSGATGDQVTPSKVGGIVAGRYLHRNELAGGLFVEGGIASKVASNTPGRWGPTAGTVDPVITLENAGGISLSGTCTLVLPRAMMYLHLDTAIAEFIDGVRIRVESAFSVNDEDFYGTGCLRILAVEIFGQQWSRGHVLEMSPQVDTTETRAGTLRKRSEGRRPRRLWTGSWADGVKMQHIRQDIDPPVMGVPGRPRAAVRGDVLTKLWGFYEAAKGGEVPVVGCFVVPKVTGVAVTSNDRTLFLNGLLEGSARMDNSTGNEGRDEFGRVPTISIRELV